MSGPPAGLGSPGPSAPGAAGSGGVLRIAAHNGAPEWGGAEIAVCRLLAGLQERGHEVRLYCGRALVARSAAAYGLDTRRLHVGGDLAGHHALRVARELRRFAPDVLVVGTFRKLLHLAAGARLAGVPVVLRVGLSTDLPRNAKYRFLVRRAVARVVVNAEDLREGYLAALPDLPPERVVAIHHGVAAPVPPLDRGAARGALCLPGGAVVVAALARLVDQKRLDRFVDVLARMPEGTLGVVAGGGPLRPALERRARERRAPVRFLGHVDDVAPVLAAADVLLVTSEREGLANAMLETLAAGVPVVSTPVSGAREALAGEEGGIPPGVVAPDFSTEALAVALEPLVRDPALRVRMGAAARERAASRFGTERMLDRWEEVLRRVARPWAGA